MKTVPSPARVVAHLSQCQTGMGDLKNVSAMTSSSWAIVPEPSPQLIQQNLMNSIFSTLQWY
ncbi:hypothetical protein [Aliirhizobium cellulosilyticum]|uniref:Uncharacterized protein n=1 Tax=Aliirhizobium cellulosilyticum TaxID=393664 RepID=A0A7W6SD62_9HYPH|nr:hypothetical protein [Rhizobium cellulosilyticum]MBB4351563.1 hypothetical protein [Rhizobium cellulosilyticum]MBB4414815.1 hypothetical protein [Rhizobium cellulosilyticum]MBB4449489.1 hypothetical protein [Rhizobium cellulosilyticum]